MPIYPDYKYDAFVHYLVIDKSGTQPLWGEDPVFINYSENLAKQCNSENSLEKSPAWRQRIKQVTSRFELSEDETYLLRNGKRVLRDREYDEVLFQFHDNSQHPGMLALRAKVIEFYGDVCYDRVDNYVRNCEVCKTRMRQKPYSKPRIIRNSPKSPRQLSLAAKIKQEQLQRAASTSKSPLTSVKPERPKAKASPLMCYPLRLHPGAEIKSTLKKFVEENELKSAFVMSCVGSVRRCQLRLADSVTIKMLEKNHEIVSLTGTLSGGGHLHASLSDETGQVIGGHVLGNMEVFTTAEIVIGNMPEFQYARKMDSQTGYDELVITAAPKDKTVQLSWWE